MNLHQSLHVFEKLANKACTGRLGLCAFLELVLSYGHIPLRELVLPSRR
jgi:hypothetical protein